METCRFGFDVGVDTVEFSFGKNYAKIIALSYEEKG
jgi:hypothetical protein